MRRHRVPSLSVLTTIGLLSAGALTCATAANAANAPAQLYSKTITVSYSSTIGGGTAAVQRVIYVSSKGRIFARGLRSGAGSSDSKDESLGTYSFSGGRIIGYHELRAGSGAAQVTISFDPSFRTCNASLRFGKSSGQPYQSRAPNGRTYSSDRPPIISGLGCAIKDGNPFGE
jgi:hypothetical protein